MPRELWGNITDSSDHRREQLRAHPAPQPPAHLRAVGGPAPGLQGTDLRTPRSPGSRRPARSAAAARGWGASPGLQCAGLWGQHDAVSGAARPRAAGGGASLTEGDAEEGAAQRRLRGGPPARVVVKHAEAESALPRPPDGARTTSDAQPGARHSTPDSSVTHAVPDLQTEMLTTSSGSVKREASQGTLHFTVKQCF